MAEADEEEFQVAAIFDAQAAGFLDPDRSPGIGLAAGDRQEEKGCENFEVFHGLGWNAGKGGEHRTSK